MERIGIREFKNRATQVLRAGKPLVIERHGEVVGYYLPLPRRNEVETRARRAAFEEALERFLEQADSNESEFERLAASLDVASLDGQPEPPSVTVPVARQGAEAQPLEPELAEALARARPLDLERLVAADFWPEGEGPAELAAAVDLWRGEDRDLEVARGKG